MRDPHALTVATASARTRPTARPLPVLCLLLALIPGCYSGPDLFHDLAQSHGLHYVSYTGDFGWYLLDTIGTGLAAADYDGDGHTDLLLLTASAIGESFAQEARKHRNQLWRNTGETFVDRTDAAGLHSGGWSNGAVFADYDGDGDLDVFIARHGPNELWQNVGDGHFREVAAQAGVADPRWSVAASFADLDGDGDLDLYVSNYAVFDIEEQRGTVRWFTVEQFPHYFPPEENILYRNDGDGSFTDVTAESGSAGNARSMTVLATDYDDDGDIDLFVANDIGFNDLYRNDGGLRFRNVAVEAGVACDAEGRFQASMGAASGDYDNDGDIDLFVTNYGAEYHTLYRNVGNGFFTDVTVAAGLATREAIDTVGWGVGLYDFDLDGNLDLLLVSGHVLDGIALFGMRNTWLAGGIDEELKAYPQMTGPAFALGSDQPKLLFLGRGDGTFLEASEQAGRTFRLPRMGRGAAFADFDDDGRIDVAVSNKNQPLQVLLNRIPPAGSWLKLELRARPPNVHAVGARVWVHTPAVTLTREILAGSSYCSSDMYTAHFGLGVDPGPVEVEVRWPDGEVERFSGLLPERHYLVRQGVPETRQIAPAPAASVAGAAHAPAAESGAYTESQRAR